MKLKCSNLFIRKDFIYGVIIIIFSILVYSQTLSQKFDVMLFPRIISIFSFVMGIVTIILSFKYNSDKKMTIYILEIVFTAFMILVMSMVKIIGFYTCIFIICSGCYGIINYFTGKRGIKFITTVLLFSVLATFCVFIAFKVLLGIITPTGLLI